jgi:ribonuclease-3
MSASTSSSARARRNSVPAAGTPFRALEERLGHRFRDPRLLEQALTHRSFGSPHNERLEFLGDGVLGCVVAEELYGRFAGAAEGELSRLRASLVREAALAAVARDIGLSAFLRLGEGELSSGGADRPSILADALEAAFGAIFLDGGYDSVRASVRRAFGDALARIDPGQPAKDAKTRLQELLQARRKKLPEYRVLSTAGAAHKQVFEVECVAEGLDLRATGSGTSRRSAEQQAAANLLKQVGG